jgi:hypothetical protein
LACTEIPPIINPLQVDQELPTPDSTLQKVLIEELTGVRCVNCPGGTAEVLRLQELLGKQVIAVALHAGSFALPYNNESKEDFRIPETASLLNYLGSPLGYPSAVVNRKRYEGERDLQLSKSLWPIFTSQEIQTAARMKIDLRVQFDGATRDLRVDVNMEALAAIEETSLKLSVMLVEDRVADVQLTPDGKKADYLHRHNLRDMLTAFNGNAIESNLAAGTQLSRNYFYTLPATWEAAECSIVAFVHLDGAKKDVLQVEKAELMP